MLSKLVFQNTFSGVLTNYFSFTSMSYNICLVKCLIDLDLKKVFNIIKKNSYPEYLLCNITRNYLNKKLDNEKEVQKVPAGSQRFFKLPNIGKFSVIAKNKMRKLC